MIAIEKINPIIIFVFFFLSFFITFLSFNPIILGIVFISSWILYLILQGYKSGFNNLLLDLCIVVLSAVINPLFSHEGETKLYYFAGNVVTAESMIYGVFAGLMVCTALLISSNFTHLIKSDGLIYVFGKFVPSLGMLLDLTFSMVPKMKRQKDKVDDSLYALGLYKDANIFKKLKLKIKVFSTTLTWAIENSVTTADSMQARGYGMMHRSSYNLHKFDVYNVILIILTMVLGIVPIVFMFLGSAEFEYYPRILFTFENNDLIVYIFTFIMMNLLSLIYIGDEIRWELLKQKI